MIPTMRKMVIRSAARYADHDDAAQQAVTAMWQEISEFDLARTQKVAATLNGRTLTRVCGDKAPDVRGRRRSRNTHLIDEVPMDTQTLVVLAASTPDPADEIFQSIAARSLGPIGEVLELIAWGLDVKALTAEDAALLAKVYAPDAGDTSRPGGRSLQLHVAQELGISHAALRKRAERAVRRLASAVLEWS
jgi:DNA-directed RNA polymerase specialized sigma24 family protein